RMLRLNLALYGARARVMRASSEKALTTIADKFHLLFIDGDHSYDACAHDVNGYTPYLHEGGTLILHDATDIGWPGPIKVARELENCAQWQLLEKAGNCVVLRKVGTRNASVSQASSN